MVWNYGGYFQKAQTAMIWARNGGTENAGGFLPLRMPKTLGKESPIDGVNSALTAAVEVPFRDAAGDLLSVYNNVPGANPGNQVTIQGVGWAETTRSNPGPQLGDSIGATPHAVMAVDRLNWWQESAGVTFFDLNDSTLVKYLGNPSRVLRNAIAINKAGYVLCNANDGKTYLLVPLTY